MDRKTKRNRQFKPLIVPRFLPGQVGNQEMFRDLYEYNKHRQRIFYMTPVVDSRPFKMDPFTRIDTKKLSGDADRLMQIDKENKSLLKKIIIINRTGGRVDTYNPIAYRQIDKWDGYNRKIKELEKQNRKFYGLLRSVKSHYSNALFNEEWRAFLEQIEHSTKFPIILLKKTSVDQKLKACPSISHSLEKTTTCIRPLCFLGFKVKDTDLYLGRIVIELYHDFVPVTVQNFMEICRGESNLSFKNCLVHRIIKGQYLESGDITKGNGRGGFSIYGKTFPEENHMLRHTKMGVISMKRVGWAENNSQFCITFSKMDTLDNKHVVFGQVIQGNGVLLKIQDYGRKIGKPLVDIVISECGECVLKISREPKPCFDKDTRSLNSQEYRKIITKINIHAVYNNKIK